MVRHLLHVGPTTVACYELRLNEEMANGREVGVEPWVDNNGFAYRDEEGDKDDGGRMENERGYMEGRSKEGDRHETSWHQLILFMFIF